MTTVLVYDTETTGLPLFDQPSEHEGQPHLVQLGAVLLNLETWKAIATLDVIVKPEGWTVPDEVAAIHGITTEHAAAVGVPEALAVELLLELAKSADYRVAHNEQFDQRIVRIACKRHFTEETAEEWKAGKAVCTARLATPILKLPPTAKMVAARRNHPKTPNLGEAYLHFTGQQLEGAHSALVDVHACIEVYRGILALQPAEA
jgi:DNA polymerase-3 subunit epsilon